MLHSFACCLGLNGQGRWAQAKRAEGLMGTLKKAWTSKGPENTDSCQLKGHNRGFLLQLMEVSMQTSTSQDTKSWPLQTLTRLGFACEMIHYSQKKCRPQATSAHACQTSFFLGIEVPFILLILLTLVAISFSPCRRELLPFCTCNMHIQVSWRDC